MTKKPKTLWKSLPADMAPHGFRYQIGKWHLHEGEVVLCERGFHASEEVIDAMGYVPAEIIAQVEVRGRSDIQNDKQAWSEMKIVKAWKWEKEDSVALSIFAAELCIKNYEKVYPQDKRPRKAIEAAKKWLAEPTEENESAAWSAAESAAWSAAESAAWSARSAWSAARSAAESAAWSAWSAARSAAESAAWSAWSAAESAARSAALKEIKSKCSAFVLKRLKNKTPIK